MKIYLNCTSRDIEGEAVRGHGPRQAWAGWTVTTASPTATDITTFNPDVHVSKETSDGRDPC